PVLAPVVVPEPPKAAPGPAAVVSDRLSIVAKDPLPRYPAESRRKREEGVVRLRVTVAIDGTVKAIAVAASSGFKRLDDAALEAVRRWRFRPKVQDGVSVEALGFIPIPFNLN
ncbi:MAG: energy transducer TonB, partial [Brevundimonas sp.]